MKKGMAVWVTVGNEIIPAVITKVSFDKGFQINRYDVLEVVAENEERRFAYHWKGPHQLLDGHLSVRTVE